VSGALALLDLVFGRQVGDAVLLHQTQFAKLFDEVLSGHASFLLFTAQCEQLPFLADDLKGFDAINCVLAQVRLVSPFSLWALDS
jgi:hypothetical protein